MLKKKLGGRGPNTRKPNDSGFYETTIRSKKKVYSYNEIYKEKLSGLGIERKNYRYHPCYDDVSNKTTLVFCIIYDALHMDHMALIIQRRVRGMQCRNAQRLKRTMPVFN